MVKDGKAPPPKKRPGGNTNLWDEDEWIAFYDTFTSIYPQPASFDLTAALVDALSTTSIDGIVSSISTLRAVLEREGASPNDVVVTLKERSATTPETTVVGND